MKFKKRLGLKINIYFLLVAFIPIFAVSVLYSLEVKRNTEDMLKENLAKLAEEIGTGIERTLFYAYTHIKSLAGNPIIKSETASVGEKLYEMQKISDFYKVFEDITLVDLDGEVIASTTYEYRGKWKYKDWFKQAKEARAVVSTVYALLYPFRLVMANTAPVFGADGNVKAVVAGRVNMDVIWDITDKVRVGKTGFIFLTDKEGNLLAHPSKGKLLYKLEPEFLRKKITESEDDATIYRAMEGIEKFCYFTKLKGYGDYKGKDWRLGISQDRDEVYSVITSMQKEIVSIAGGCFLFVLLVSGLLTRNITGPIKTLSGMSKKIADGDLTARVPVMTKDEIGDLGNSFNEMALNLQKTTVSRDYVENIIKSMADPLIIVTREGRLRRSNYAVFDLLGYKLIDKQDLSLFSDEFLDKDIKDLFPQEFAEEIMSCVERALSLKKVELFEYEFMKLKAGPRVMETRCMAIGRDEALVLIRDITDRKRAEEKLKETLEKEHGLALTDELTHLYNRRGFMTLAHQQLNIARRNMEEVFLLFIDLDNMKWINDTYGHEAGDRALVTLADIMRKTFREQDIIARIGGDEFAVLMTRVSGANIEFPIMRLHRNLSAESPHAPARSEPSRTSGYKLSVSVGIASYNPSHPSTIDELLTNADRMMYEEKKKKQGTA